MRTRATSRAAALLALLAGPGCSTAVELGGPSPKPADDVASTPEDVAVVVDVLANDTDPEGRTLIVAGVGNGANGSVTLGVDGTVTYTPDPGFNGADAFVYTVTDAIGWGSPPGATVGVTVEPVNDEPVGVADDYAVDEDDVLVVDATAGVLGNDADVDSPDLTVSLVDDVLEGTLDLAADGSFTYVANPDYEGSDSFTYMARDGDLSSTAVTVALTVNPVNDAPVGGADAIDALEDTELVVGAPGVLANDTDLEGDNLTAVKDSDPAMGMLTSFNADGSFTYVPDPDFIGDDTFTYHVEDGALSSSSVTVTIQVADVPPVVSIADESAPESSGPFRFFVTLNETSTSDVLVDVMTFGMGGAGSATAGQDFQSLSDTVTVMAGDLSAPVDVTLLGDAVNEADEVLSLNIMNVTGGTVGDGNATGTIADDDPTVVTIANGSVAEGDSGFASLPLAVSLSVESQQSITVMLVTSDGTASTADSDYSVFMPSVTLDPGDLSQNFVVFVNGDLFIEGNETLTAHVDSVSGRGVSGIGNSATGTITNDDTLTIANWTGAVSDSWSDPGNWDIASVPDARHRVTFTNAADCVVDTGAEVAGVLIGATYAGTLSMNVGTSLTARSHGWTQQGGTVIASGFFGVDVRNGFEVSGGSFTLPMGRTLRIGGDVALGLAAFNAASGSTLRLDGEGSQVVKGLTSIVHGLVVENAGPARIVDFDDPLSIESTGSLAAFADDADIRLRFAEASTNQVNGSGTVSFSANAPHLVRLSDGSANAIQWTLDVDASASTTFDRIHLVDCNAAGTAAPLTATDSVDAGNNTNWLFNP